MNTLDENIPEKLPIVVLGIVTNKRGEVLIIQRFKEEKGTGEIKLSWAFPGGTLENDETKEQTVEREILEETGYKVKAGSVVSERQHPQFPVHIYYLECILVNETITVTSIDPDIAQSKWIKREDIKNYFTTDIDKRVYDYLMKDINI